ncbi:SRPBCC family protein [Ruegeria lacuscaerulensis]|uniref:SRPBCC family protein n=1 Tax=Ruegeria lacuscaerulensis TaxID=55218 RepID=UPI00147CFC59|nr:SRPBCC family protein [Ruegeria lacuscaerulensis]
MHVFRSMVIEAEIDKVWSAVRAFDSVSAWNPGVELAELETGTKTAIGTIRKLHIPDGSVFRETLLAHSDLDHFYTYDILESPLPVNGYVATHRFIPITHTRQTLGIWESRFECAPSDCAELERIVGDVIYIGGMTGLNTFLKGE